MRGVILSLMNEFNNDPDNRATYDGPRRKACLSDVGRVARFHFVS